jgi:hypothetical protein
MLEILQKFNYEPPFIKELQFGQVSIKKIQEQFLLFIKDEIVMSYDYSTHYQAADIFAQYYLAKGHTIVTGLGLGVREKWILTKKEVSKLTIIENCQEVIEINKQLNPELFSDPRVEIICEDAHTYKGSCDVLLLNHYGDLVERKEFNRLVEENINPTINNIDHTYFWYRGLEKEIFELVKQGSDFFNAYLKVKQQYKLTSLYQPTYGQMYMFFCMGIGIDIFINK